MYIHCLPVRVVGAVASGGDRTDLYDVDANRGRSSEVSREDNRPGADDRRRRYEKLIGQERDNFDRSRGDLGDGMGRNAEATGSVVIDRIPVRVRNRKRSTDQHEDHAEHAEQYLPAAERGRLGS